MSDTVPGDRRERVEDIAAHYRDRLSVEHVFFFPGIPSRKLHNAISFYAPGVRDDDVLVLVDDTALGSGKQGGLLTRTTFHARIEEPVQVDLADITEVRAGGVYVYVDGRRFLPMRHVGPGASTWFAAMVREMATASGAAVAPAEPAVPRQRSAEPAQPPAGPQPADTRVDELTRPERILTVMPFVELEKRPGSPSAGTRTGTVVVTNHRMVFAEMTWKIARHESLEAKEILKTEKGPLGRTLFSREREAQMVTLLLDRYRQLAPDDALAESEANFSIPTADVLGIELAPVRLTNTLSELWYGDVPTEPSYIQVGIRAATASYTLRVDQQCERAAPDWRQTLTDLFGRRVLWQGPQPEPAPPAPVSAPAAAGETGAAEPEAYIRASLSQPAATDAQAAELEHRRIDAVQAIAQTGRAGGDEGRRAAVDALVRLLDVDTGYLPVHATEMKKTMRVSVVTALGESGDSSAVDPLIRVMQKEQEAAQDAARASLDAPMRTKEGQEFLRRAQLAGEVFNKAAEALGRLGDATALPALREALEKAPVGTKRSAKKAIKAIESVQRR